jgi:hypothetical protein
VKRILSNLALVLLGLGGAQPAQASSLQVTASLSENTIASGDVFVLEVRASTTINSEITIQVPRYPWASELGRRQSQSSQFSFGTGGQKIKREQTLVVELQAKKSGSFRLENIRAQAGTTRASAPVVILTVLNNQQAIASRAVVGQVTPPADNEKNLFVRYRPNKAKAYLGEQIILDLDIFANGNFSLDQTKPPALNGFWREMIEQPTQLRARDIRVNGQRYRAYRLWRMAIFPLEAGTRLIEATQLGFSMNRSIFSTGKRLRRTAPPLEIDVLPLPTEGRPKGFVSTNVGNYQLSATIDKQNVAPGKAVVLKLTLRGSGNIKSAKLPSVQRVDGFRVFPPTTKDSMQVSAQGVSGVKEAEMILMPLRGGRLTIPTFELAVFNPSRQTYERLRTRSFTVFVQGDPSIAAATNPQVINPIKPRPKPISKDALKPLRFRSQLSIREAPITSTSWFIPALFAPLLLLGLVVLAEQAKAQVSKETPASKRRKAAVAAQNRLSKAQDAADKGAPEKAYMEINEALLEYASEKSGVAIRGLTMDETRDLLGRKNAPETVIEDLIQELENCDFARFAPGANEKSAIEEALARASRLIADLQDWEIT